MNYISVIKKSMPIPVELIIIGTNAYPTASTCFVEKFPRIDFLAIWK